MKKLMLAICFAIALVSCDPRPADPPKPKKDSCRVASIGQGLDTLSTLHWNEDNLLTKAFLKDFNGKNLTAYYIYNSAGKIVRSYSEDIKEGVFFDYDNMGRVDSITRFSFDTSYYEFEYELNNIKPSRMEVSYASGSGKRLQYEYEFEYNSSGDIVKMHKTSTSGGELVTTFTHDTNPNCLRAMRTVDFGLNWLNATWFEEYTTLWNEHNILSIRNGPFSAGQNFTFGYFMNQNNQVDSIAINDGGGVRPVKLTYSCEN